MMSSSAGGKEILRLLTIEEKQKFMMELANCESSARSTRSILDRCLSIDVSLFSDQGEKDSLANKLRRKIVTLNERTRELRYRILPLKEENIMSFVDPLDLDNEEQDQVHVVKIDSTLRNLRDLHVEQCVKRDEIRELPMDERQRQVKSMALHWVKIYEILWRNTGRKEREDERLLVERRLKQQELRDSRVMECIVFLMEKHRRIMLDNYREQDYQQRRRQQQQQQQQQQPQQQQQQRQQQQEEEEEEEQQPPPAPARSPSLIVLSSDDDDDAAGAAAAIAAAASPPPSPPAPESPPPGAASPPPAPESPPPRAGGRRPMGELALARERGGIGAAMLDPENVRMFRRCARCCRRYDALWISRYNFGGLSTSAIRHRIARECFGVTALELSEGYGISLEDAQEIKRRLRFVVL